MGQKKVWNSKRKIRKERRDQPLLFERGTPRKHSVSVVDIRGDKGKHKNRLEIVSHGGNYNSGWKARVKKWRIEGERREIVSQRKMKPTPGSRNEAFFDRIRSAPVSKTCNLDSTLFVTGTIVSLNQTTETEVLLDDDIWDESVHDSAGR